jgi:hypothetical protein
VISPEVVELVVPALVVACVVKIALTVRKPPGASLPHPSKFGLPTGGLASAAAAHAALAGRSARSWWKFW